MEMLSNCDPEKQLSGILASVFQTTDLIPLLWNALEPTLSTEAGITSDSMSPVNLNAASPMDFNVEGKDTEARLRYLSKAFSPIAVTPSGITIF